MIELRNLSTGAGWLMPVVLLWAFVSPGKAQPLPTPRPLPEASTPAALGLPDLLRLALEQNPALRQGGYDVEAARGRAVQAGLYPNPTLSLVGDEIGAQGGLHGPQLSQEVVTAGKRGLSQSVAGREVDQAQLALQRQRYALFTTVRQGYFEVLADRRRFVVLDELVGLATESYEKAKKSLEAKEIAELDLLQFQVELDRFRAQRDATRREEAAAWGRLTASIGVSDLPPAPLVGLLDEVLPDYDLETARATLVESHPEILSAQVGVARAQLALRRAEAEAVPNVTVSAGYRQNFNDRESQGTYLVGIPLPVFNRNQGNIHAAQAELGRATQEVSRVQNDLLGRLATAYGQYAAAREVVERYRTSIIPSATRAYRLSLVAFKGGQFEYLRVLQAQRAVAEANLEYLRSLSDAWRSASELAGLLLEERWPAPSAGGG